MSRRIRTTLPLFLLLSLIIGSCTDFGPEGVSIEPACVQGSWPVSTPEAQSLDRRLLTEGYVAAAKLPYTYSLLVVRNGYLVAEQYFNGSSRTTANNVMSVSKSVLSALAGIALREGYLDNLDEKVLDYFPEYVTPSLDSMKFRITIRHLLTMRAGFEHEEVNYFSIYNSADWIRTTIELPLRYPPGDKMSYNTFQTHLLSAIMTKTSGMNTFDYARTYLCEPLGITLVFWRRDPQGYYFGGNSMGFTPRDMGRFGYLYLNGGSLDGKQIVPRAWVEESLLPSTNWGSSLWGDLRNAQYGRLWWLGELNGHRAILAIGHGGQYVVVIPDLQMIAVTTANPNFDWDTADEHERAILHIIAAYVVKAANG
jgi:CubicO group peptidase (beta-lactamase class C family)